MRKLLIYLLFIITITNAYTQEEENWRLIGQKNIFTSQNDSGITIDANSKWIKLNNIDAPFFKDIPQPAPGYIRKWRIVSRYSDNDPSIKTSFQFKFMINRFKRPTFSFERPLGYNGILNGFSQWFQFEDGTAERTYKGDAGVYVRVISPPTSDNNGTIYDLELQAWDVLINPEVTKEAAGRALPNTDLFNEVSSEVTKKTIKQANHFALEVMETIFNKDAEEFNSLLADRCYSLEYGTVYYKDRIPLYTNLQEITGDSYITLASYKKNYKPQLIKYSEYSELFPHWIDKSREWIPGENDFLFFGNMITETGKEILQSRMAVFMIGFNNGRWEIKAIPE